MTPEQEVEEALDQRIHFSLAGQVRDSSTPTCVMERENWRHPSTKAALCRDCLAWWARVTGRATARSFL